MRRWIEINRAPVLTLWAAIVAERLGIDWEEVLTLGRAVAGLNAYSKGKALGLFEPTPEAIKEKRRQLRREKGAFSVDLLNRKVPAVHTEAGIRALQKDQPTNPVAVMNYLTRAFGDVLDDARDAMASLASAHQPQELASIAHRLYEEFRFGELNPSATGEHAAQPDGAQDHRERGGLAEPFSPEAQVGNVLQHPLSQAHAYQIGNIGFQRLFSVGSAVDVIEQKAGQLASRGFAII